MDTSWLARAIGYPLAVRIGLGEDVPVPRRTVRAARTWLNEASDLAMGLDLSKPSSWLDAADNVLEHLEERGRGGRGQQAFERFSKSPEWQAFRLSTDQIADVLRRRGDHRVVAAETSPRREYRAVGPFPVISEYSTYAEGWDHTVYAHESWPHDAITDAVRELFWRAVDTVELREGSGGIMGSTELKIRDVDQSGRSSYIGPLEDLRDRMLASIDGVRGTWQVMTAGKPGMGKTTLCWDVARRAGGRAVVLDSTALSEYTSQSRWTIRLLEPRVVIVDDVDRLKRPGQHLDALEGAFGGADLAVLTANHPGRLPEAFMRPGRIDHFAEAEMPDEAGRARIRRHFADLHGAPAVCDDEARERLDELHASTTNAHAEEAIRRAAAFGWNDSFTWKLDRPAGSIEPPEPADDPNIARYSE